MTRGNEVLCWTGVIASAVLLDMMSTLNQSLSLSLSLSLFLSLSPISSPLSLPSIFPPSLSLCLPSLLLPLEFDITLASSTPSGNFHVCHEEQTNHEGAVRIFSSHSDYTDEFPTGIVEVYMNGAWGPVCYSEGRLMEADVVCKQLSFPAAFSATEGYVSLSTP